MRVIRVLHFFFTVILLILQMLLGGCSDPIQRDISRLVEGGEDAEKAKMKLNLAKGSAILPLIEALHNKEYPSRARADIAEALYRLYLREADPKIWEALIGGLEDQDPTVRAAVVRVLGDLRKRAGTRSLVDLLEHEASDAVRGEILTSLEVMANTGGAFGAEIQTDKFTAEEKVRLADILVRLIGEELPRSLRLQALDWLEILAEEKAVEARTLMLQAHLQEAEALLLAARDLIPDSKNINHTLGRFYYDNGNLQKGLEILEERGLLVRVPRLERRPRIDGVLDEPGWRGVVPIGEFYQCIPRMRAYPIEGRSEAYVGYLGDTLYVGIKGYEESTETLVAQTTERDQFSLSRDDCVEIFLDVDHDYQTYYQLLINSLGTLTDVHWAGSRNFEEIKVWNGRFDIATDVQDTFWAVEVALPSTEFHNASMSRGDIWGFNIARVRIPSAEYGQWAPTYGSANRPGRFGFLVFE